MLLTFTNKVVIPIGSADVNLGVVSQGSTEDVFFPVPAPFRVKGIAVVSVGPNSESGSIHRQPGAAVTVELFVGDPSVAKVTVSDYGHYRPFSIRKLYQPKQESFNYLVSSLDPAFIHLRVSLNSHVRYAIQLEHLRVSVLLESPNESDADDIADEDEVPQATSC